MHTYIYIKDMNDFKQQHHHHIKHNKIIYIVLHSMRFASSFIYINTNVYIYICGILV